MRINWWITFQNPSTLWSNNPSFIIGEWVFIIGGLCTMTHAFRNGGRHPYIWLGIILHGITVEAISYFIPDIDNFWHGQATIMFLGGRLPLYILCVYLVFMYISIVAVCRMNLTGIGAACAAGLCEVLIDIPYDIMGIKLLWWTWHDTDPNIYDRSYWVPWTSYLFHASFGAAFFYLSFQSRKFISTKQGITNSEGFLKELFCTAISGTLAMPLGVIAIMIIYHPLHDIFEIHTEVCVTITLAFFIYMAWKSSCSITPISTCRGYDELNISLMLHYTIFPLLSVLIDPSKIQSEGLHEPVSQTVKDLVPVKTPIGMTLYKQRFLNPSNYNEAYFDFNCVKTLPLDGQDWYTVCGNPYPNHIEYVLIVTTASLFGYNVLNYMLAATKLQQIRRKKNK